MSEKAICTICGEPMPEGEEMFKFHGYSGPCPRPPLPSTELFSCPFCSERGFDLPGLKIHLDIVGCEKYDAIDAFAVYMGKKYQP